MPVLEEAKTMVYVTNHNMITMAMVIFKTYKMAVFLARTGRKGFAMFACYEFPIDIYAVFKHHTYFLEQCSTYMLR